MSQIGGPDPRAIPKIVIREGSASNWDDDAMAGRAACGHTVVSFAGPRFWICSREKTIRRFRRAKRDVWPGVNGEGICHGVADAWCD
jgi:hypothetical protein